MNDPYDRFVSATDLHGRVRHTGRDQCRWDCLLCGAKHAGSAKRTETEGVIFGLFCGCEKEQHLERIGLTFTDLFPQRLSAHATSKPRRIGLMTTGQALDLIASEAWLIAVAGENLASGHALAAPDLSRLRTASVRIQNIITEYRK